ncbi:MAG TPA: DnaJ domain-containing protein [Kofleriaceae bacterium]
MTLGALGLRGLTGQLTLSGQYKVAFQDGAIVGAFSPLANDAAVRLALTGNLITSSQVSDITRRIAAAPERDEVEVLAEACRLQPEQAQRLRRRLVAQRAARTFSIDSGEFVVEDRIAIAVVPGSELDVRAIVYLGARNNLSEDRLAAELAQLGVWFKLKAEAIEDLPQFGFTEDDKPLLQMIAQGANLSDLEQANIAIGARTVRAVTYSLAACGACDASATAGPAIQRAPGTTLSPPTVAAQTGSPQNLRGGNTVPPPATAPEQKHKTAPLGSRSPSAGSQPPASGRVPTRNDHLARVRTPTGASVGIATGRVPTRNDAAPRSPAVGRSPTPNAPVAGRVSTPSDGEPRGPRTITESTGVPRESDGHNSSGATSSTGSFRAQRDRSPSGGVHAHDRSPSAGVPVNRGSSAGIPRPGSQTSRPGSPTSRPGSQTSQPLTPRTRTASSAGHLRPPGDPPARAGTSSQSGRGFSTQPPPVRGRPRRAKQSTAATMEIEALLTKKIPMLDQGVDYFTLFGLQIGASPEDVRSTYFMLARKLHPDRLAAIGIEDEDRQAQRLMACINEAFAVLNDPVRRAEYLSVLNRGGEAAVRAEEQKADEMAMRIMRAEESFRQGEMALRREQIAQAVIHFTTAVELQPNEAEYQALLAWAQFAAASDKSTIANQTRRALLRAVEANSESPTARFYLGRVERMLGREKEALYCFYEVLKIKPNHSEATSEARILEQRLRARR